MVPTKADNCSSFKDDWVVVTRLWERIETRSHTVSVTSQWQTTTILPKTMRACFATSKTLLTSLVKTQI